MKLDEFDPKDDKVKTEEFNIDDVEREKAWEFVRNNPLLMRILLYTAHKSVTWISDISRRFMIPYDEAQKKIYLLMNLGFLKQIPMPKDYVHPLLRRRIHELWSVGIKGYAAFNRMLIVSLATPDIGGDIKVEDWIKNLRPFKDMIKEFAQAKIDDYIKTDEGV